MTYNAIELRPKVGDRMLNLVGQWMEIVEMFSPWRFRVQPLTTVGIELRPLGGTVVVGRSDLK